MPDYKEMYLTMVRASEKAINILTAAQRECEELYLSSPEAEITVLKSGDEEPSRAVTRPGRRFF